MPVDCRKRNSVAREQLPSQPDGLERARRSETSNSQRATRRRRGNTPKVFVPLLEPHWNRAQTAREQENSASISTGACGSTPRKFEHGGTGFPQILVPLGSSRLMLLCFSIRDPGEHPQIIWPKYCCDSIFSRAKRGPCLYICNLSSRGTGACASHGHE